jgi:glycosyltransferase involved in cell wall biosynthesis
MSYKCELEVRNAFNVAIMKAVIFLAYEFPPLNVGGAQRPYRFARYLNAAGYYPIVITPEAPLHNLRLDDDFDDEVISPEFCTIVRTRLGPPRHSRLQRSGYASIVGDEALRWRAYCIDAARKIAQTHEVAAVLATAPPFSISELGSEVADMLRCPMILDMRDAWSQWVITPYATKLHYLLTKRREAAALRRAAKVITTSEQTRRDLLKIHTHIADSKIVTIHNSYEEICSSRSNVEVQRNPSRFTIGYVGSFYYEPYQRQMMFAPWWKKRFHQFLQYVPRREDWLYRSPEFFFRAVSNLRNVAPQAYERLRVEFAGQVPNWLPQMIAQHRLEEKITLLGPVSRSRSLELQRSYDALLITSSKVLGGRDYSIAGKTFEYVSIGSPIIAFVCEGAQRDLLEKTGLAKICDPDNEDQSVEGLLQVIERKFIAAPDHDEIRKLSIGQSIHQLAELIRTLESANGQA